MKKLEINMLHMTNQPQGQGVASATTEQINLLLENAQEDLIVLSNQKEDGDINHFHQIDPLLYLRIKGSQAINVMHVHFLPETLDGSISMPKPIMDVIKLYSLDFYKSADYLVVVNPIFIEPLTSYGIHKDKIKYIPNYVSKDKFHPIDVSQRNEFRKKYNISPDAFVVIGVGQVQTRKGVIDFVEVAKQIPDVTFVWAGGFSFGVITDGYKELKEVVENPPENVIFTDIIPREDMNKVYNMADVLFMPSYNELFPMAILEACNSHVPMVLRDLDLYVDILFEKYLKGHDNHDFTDLINELKKKEALYTQATAFSKEISEIYSKENVSKQWIDFYQKIYKDRQNTHKHFIDADTYDNILAKETSAIIESSAINPMPVGNIQVNDLLELKKIGSFSSEKIIVKVTAVHYHQRLDSDDNFDFIAPFKEKINRSEDRLSRHASKVYLTIIEFDNVVIYADKQMNTV